MRENTTKPLTGTGSGTFEFWWARDGDTDETVRDTHSLYLQTLGELGIVGFALIVGLPRRDRRRRSPPGARRPGAGSAAVRRRPGRLRRVLHHRGVRLDVAAPRPGGGGAAARLDPGHARTPGFAGG